MTNFNNTFNYNEVNKTFQDFLDRALVIKEQQLNMNLVSPEYKNKARNEAFNRLVHSVPRFVNSDNRLIS